MDDPQSGKMPPVLKAIIDRANQGDTSVLPQLRQALKDFPEVRKSVGDLSNLCEVRLLEVIAGSNLLLREAVREELKLLRDKLHESASSELEQLLVDQICLCQLELNQARMQQVKWLETDPGGTMSASTAAMKRLNSAQHRFLSSVRALANLQKLRPGRSILDVLGPDLPKKAAARKGPKNRMETLVGVG